MNATFEDVEMEPPANGSSYETIPAGMYPARLVGFTTCDKPDWKLTGEEDEDKQQWQWVFEITDGEYAGLKINEYTNRSWHEKAKAHKHAAALLGVPELPVGQGLSTKTLANRTCQILVIEKGTKKDPNDLRNYVDKVLPTPAPRQRAQRPAQPAQDSPAVKQVVVPQLQGGVNTEDEEDDLPF